MPTQEPKESPVSGKADADLREFFKLADRETPETIDNFLKSRLITPERLSSIVPQGADRVIYYLGNVPDTNSLSDAFNDDEIEPFARAHKKIDELFGTWTSDPTFQRSLKELIDTRDPENAAFKNRLRYAFKDLRAPAKFTHDLIYIGEPPNLTPNAQVAVFDDDDEPIMNMTVDVGDCLFIAKAMLSIACNTAETSSELVSAGYASFNIDDSFVDSQISGIRSLLERTTAILDRNDY